MERLNILKINLKESPLHFEGLKNLVREYIKLAPILLKRSSIFVNDVVLFMFAPLRVILRHSPSKYEVIEPAEKRLERHYALPPPRFFN